MDDLLKPSLQDQSKLRFDPLPFSPRSQFLVTFFGGVASGWFYTYINSERLKVDKKTINQIHLMWLVAVIVTTIAYYVVAGQIEQFSENREMQRYLRYGNRILGILVYLVVARLQNSWFTRYRWMTGGDGEPTYANPWGYGLAAVFLVPILHGILLLIAVQMAGG